MNKKIIYIWIIIILLEIFFIFGLPYTCVDPGGCGYWIFLGGEKSYLQLYLFKSQWLYSILLLSPIIVGILSIFFWKK